MAFLKKYAIWIICILSFFTAFFYNQINLSKLPEELKRENQTVVTNDDYSYLNPPEIYNKTGEWKQTGIGKQVYFLRTPGYGIIYYAILKTAGANNTLYFLKLFQLLLFSISVYWLFSIANTLLPNKTHALIVAGIYGLTPFAVGFLFYTLTEGITPALLLLFVFLLFKANKKETKNSKYLFYLLAALSFAFLLLLRPALGFLGILLPVFLVYDYWNTSIAKTIIKLVLFGSIAFSFTLIWQYRNYKITNKIVGLHPIYYPSNNTMFRPTLREFWNFNKSWAVEGYVYHSYSLPFWLSAINGDSSEVYIKNILSEFPPYVVNFYGKDRLTNIFIKYQKSILYQKTYYEKQLPMPEKTPEIELEVIKEFQQLTAEYKSEFWFQYHVISPLKVFKTMAFHSNLSLYIFQKTYRGNWLMETVRFLFFGIHSLCFIGLLLSLFLVKKMNWKQTAINGCLFIYVFYLCYFQRGIEERYTLPILPFLLIGLLSFLMMIKQLILGSIKHYIIILNRQYFSR